MPTTCPRCGTKSSAASESCRECGHDLYRVSYPEVAEASPLNLRAVGGIPRSARLAASGAVLVLGGGLLAGLTVAGGEDEGPVSNKKIPATALPREPTATPEPSSPKPSKTEAPPKPAPATTSPPPSTPPPEPSYTPTSGPSGPGVSEAEWAREFAERLREKYGTPGPGRTHWEHHEHGDGYSYDYEYSYDYDYQRGE